MDYMDSDSVYTAIKSFCFLYPLFMSWVWMAGSINYYLRYERRFSNPAKIPSLGFSPKISLVVPCFNEENEVKEVVINLLNQDYPNFDVIAINDGSSDKTGEILDRLAISYPRLRVLHHAKNQGKAVALTSAALLTDSEYLLCIDGDALLDQNAGKWMVRHFIGHSRVGAVTGNPRIRNRSTMLGKIQVGEFSSIVGLIKRAQRIYGRLFTVSGVCVMFRKSALIDVGFWSAESLTEDIDISWKLQLRFWDVRFEPAATCWILMPETFTGLFKQRIRWAMGGCQALFKYYKYLFKWQNRRMWAILLEFIVSMFWAYSMVFIILGSIIGIFFPVFSQVLAAQAFFPAWAGALLGVTSLLQSALALRLDRRYDQNLLSNLFYVIWYPLGYWVIGMLTSVIALPRALFRNNESRGLWISPDRGYKK